MFTVFWFNKQNEFEKIRSLGNTINVCMWDSAMCKARKKYVVKQKLKKQNSNVYGYSLLESLRKNDVLNIEGGGVGVTQGEGGRGGV